MPASVFRVPFIASAWTYGGRNRREIQKCQIKSDSITLLYQTISHTFCTYCFVLCPACIFTVLSAWKVRDVHGIQKASL
ncbi:unnamed protein product [Staurois parvus]|uniref:Uncharacterized protein n=1 Tax=Staurois parvus TaxID=386267 RepID=A0ABN9C445_9NEOB|nr:unnamed protein product [Staurois parvus]